MKLFKKLFNLFIISNIFILYLTNSGCKMYSGISINESNYYSDDFNKNFEIFESRIEELRNKYHIPSISAGIIKNDSLAWYKGFGFANIEDSIVPNKNTIYHIASLTKPFTSTLIMQLVDEGKVSLNDPVSKYGIKIKGLRKIKVKHFLSHTSGGKIWKSFKYSSGRFGKLEEIIEKSSGISFGENMLNRIIKPLDLQNTAPNYQDTLNFKLTGYNLQNYLNKLAKPYQKSDSSYFELSEYPDFYGTSAGLLSSVNDLAKFSIAIDKNKIISEQLKKIAFTPEKSTIGNKQAYGLGWFISYINDCKVVWHYGLWTCNSSILVKIPEKNISLIFLANSDNLTMPFNQYTIKGKLTGNPFAKEFVDAFLR